MKDPAGKKYVNFNFVLRMSEAKLSQANGKILIMKKEQKDVVSKMYRLGCSKKNQIWKNYFLMVYQKSQEYSKHIIIYQKK